jgi:hypothetical protein
MTKFTREPPFCCTHAPTSANCGVAFAGNPSGAAAVTVTRLWIGDVVI